MRELSKNELLEINGGTGITAAFLNAFARTISTVVDVGRSFGSSIRRLVNGNVCPL